MAKNCLPITKVGTSRGKRPPALKSPLSFTSRDLAGTDPNKEQFAPTESCPIPNRQKMGGMS
jgi:hypothetical protein